MAGREPTCPAKGLGGTFSQVAEPATRSARSLETKDTTTEDTEIDSRSGNFELRVLRGIASAQAVAHPIRLGCGKRRWAVVILSEAKNLGIRSPFAALRVTRIGFPQQKLIPGQCPY